MPQTTKPTRKKPTRHQRTISAELFGQWRKLERKNDSTVLAKHLNVSKPTIDKALIYGCVHQQVLVDGITTYFADRIMRETATAEGLRDLQDKKDQA